MLAGNLMSSLWPSAHEYFDLARGWHLLPVIVEGKWSGENRTPVPDIEQLSAGKEMVLWESTRPHVPGPGWSLAGCNIAATYLQRGAAGCISAHPLLIRLLVPRLVEMGVRVRTVAAGKLYLHGSPFSVLRAIQSAWRIPAGKSLLHHHGMLGYLSYDTVRWLEQLPPSPQRKDGMPDALFLLPAVWLGWDRNSGRLTVSILTLPHSGTGPLRVYDWAVREGERYLGRLIACLSSSLSSSGAELPEATVRKAEMPATTTEVEVPWSQDEEQASWSYAQFVAAVKRALNYIHQGEIFQVVLARRLEIPYEGDPWRVYLRLREVNPSPYLFFIRSGPLVLCGSSPEMLVRVRESSEKGERVVETCPIAGTRSRGSDEAEDNVLARELVSDEKERAEHLMLVDLARNDLGRVCIPGSVTVTRFMAVEKYSHVMHLVSVVKGLLISELTVVDALTACFPAGTVSGAPKVRAMEIINELEPVARGPYAGAVGLLGLDGSLDTAITIRTIVFNGRRAFVQAGAGIVADSVPEKEYQEIVKKSQALMVALSDDGRR